MTVIGFWEMKKFKPRFLVANKIFFSVVVFLISLMVTGFLYKQFFIIKPNESENANSSDIPTESPVAISTFAPDKEYTLRVISSLTPTMIPQSGNTRRHDSGYGYPCDNRFATTEEIFEALNNYRNAHGAGSLVWNEKLAEVARMRVKQTLLSGRDYHKGFIEYTNDQDNYLKVGFWSLSENIGTSGDCPLLGVHLIEFKISRSPVHDAAQRDPTWIAVGIATEGGVTSFIFGRDPM